MLNMGWGVCVCISLSFPRNEVSFFFFSQSKIERVGREEGGCKKPGMREGKMTTVPPSALNPTI